MRSRSWLAMVAIAAASVLIGIALSPFLDRLLAKGGNVMSRIRRMGTSIALTGAVGAVALGVLTSPDWLDSLSDWADLLQVVGVPLAAGALLLAWRQLAKAARTARVQIALALALDESLSAFEEVRLQLNVSPQKVTDHVKLRRYMAAMERIGYALRSGEIPLETVDRFYGGRFAKLLKYRPALDIAKPRDGWEEFYCLWGQLYGYDDNKRNIPQPPGGSGGRGSRE
jgi:hypothetical protein